MAQYYVFAIWVLDLGLIPWHSTVCLQGHSGLRCLGRNAWPGQSDWYPVRCCATTSHHSSRGVYVVLFQFSHTLCVCVYGLWDCMWCSWCVCCSCSLCVQGVGWGCEGGRGVLYVSVEEDACVVLYSYTAMCLCMQDMVGGCSCEFVCLYSHVFVWICMFVQSCVCVNLYVCTVMCL